MPAITVDDLTVLPRLREPGLGDQPRPVWQVTTAPSGFEGEGFPVRRAFAGIDLQHLDPFIMMDQMGEVEYAPGEAKGTPWHPHRGFETVTYIIDGVFDHQDSHGGGGTITNGDTQWMTAGSGLLHIEAPPEWLVAAGRPVPRHPALGEPAARRQDEQPEVPGHPLRRGPAAHLGRRRLAGPRHRRLGRRATPVPGSTYTPMSLVHATVEPGARLDLPWDVDFNALVYVLNGSGTVGTEGRPIHTGQSAVLGAGDYLTITADQAPGEPLAQARRDRGRRQADPRAARLGRSVRDEHQGRGPQGLRGLPARPLRPHPRVDWLAAWPGSTATRTASRTSGPPTCSTSPTGRAGSTARDRSWQLEYQRRRATGTAAEVLGAAAAAVGHLGAADPDRRHRPAGVRRAGGGDPRLRHGVRRGRERRAARGVVGPSPRADPARHRAGALGAVDAAGRLPRPAPALRERAGQALAPPRAGRARRRRGAAVPRPGVQLRQQRLGGRRRAHRVRQAADRR